MLWRLEGKEEDAEKTRNKEAQKYKSEWTGKRRLYQCCGGKLS
jgi:hypothetical protein